MKDVCFKLLKHTAQLIRIVVEWIFSQNFCVATPIYLVTVGFVHARRKNMETELSLWKCAKPSFSVHTTRRKSTLKRHNHRSFWICVWGKRGQGNEWHCYWTNCNLIVFEKLRLNNFPSTLKRKAGAFQFLWFENSFSFRFSVDGRLNRKKAFSRFFDVAGREP